MPSSLHKAVNIRHSPANGAGDHHRRALRKLPRIPPKGSVISSAPLLDEQASKDSLPSNVWNATEAFAATTDFSFATSEFALLSDVEVDAPTSDPRTRRQRLRAMRKQERIVRRARRKGVKLDCPCEEDERVISRTVTETGEVTEPQTHAKTTTSAGATTTSTTTTAPKDTTATNATTTTSKDTTTTSATTTSSTTAASSTTTSSKNTTTTNTTATSSTTTTSATDAEQGQQTTATVRNKGGFFRWLTRALIGLARVILHVLGGIAATTLIIIASTTPAIGLPLLTVGIAYGVRKLIQKVRDDGFWKTLGFQKVPTLRVHKLIDRIKTKVDAYKTKRSDRRAQRTQKRRERAENRDTEFYDKLQTRKLRLKKQVEEVWGECPCLDEMIDRLEQELDKESQRRASRRKKTRFFPRSPNTRKKLRQRNRGRCPRD